ncbi:hypothetical protein NC653_027902 [Populus alba x Populus x berolinensis]|uniref:Class II aldolase/adducin N-terminal domain-containing protein n=1 Tax=Populus alba x Populus x berolinensis TaxID=444605 RepID=A0AAD6M7G6_9ROSI|nr:hypothetical protein NC653_027902 [Populus alba x Populus x berolinensis]
MSPSGVQKERMEPEDMYVFATNGSILSSPSPKPYPHKPPKCSDCASLFLKSYDMRNAGDVIHSPGSSFFLNLQITYMEMIKGIQGHGYYDELVVPIIENTAYENKLTDSLAKAIEAYQKQHLCLFATMTYIYGETHGSVTKPRLNRCIVLDIEGTTTPIIFVADVLFPYAHDNVGRHLSATYETAETHDDIKLLRTQVEDDLKQGIDGAVPIPTDDAGKEEGHIWRTGYENNELEGVVYGDVPEALEKWHALGIKVYIYSSGSRLAQRLIFGKTNYGDLRKYLSGFFDTKVGNKKEIRSYIEISESLGVNKPFDILFLTDVFQEAVAAKAAGNKLLLVFYFIKCCKTSSKILLVHRFTTSLELLNQFNGFPFFLSTSLF